MSTFYRSFKLPAFEEPEDGQSPCTCREEIPDVECYSESPDYNYGADADGNRGIYVPGFCNVEGEAPDSCETCGYKLTEKDKEYTIEVWNKELEDYVYEEPEPDYYDEY